MGKHLGINKPFAMTIRRRMGPPRYEEDGSLFGVSRFGYGQFGAGDIQPLEPWHGIYQMRATRWGVIPYRSKFYRPSQPNTEKQINIRKKFADAVTAWQSLTDQEKNEYNERAKHLPKYGYHIFISEYMKEQ